ncbi:hypothetical protein BD769DRAFT_1488250, partial [Suillus cothurnatus]
MGEAANYLKVYIAYALAVIAAPSMSSLSPLPSPQRHSLDFGRSSSHYQCGRFRCSTDINTIYCVLTDDLHLRVFHVDEKLFYCADRRGTRDTPRMQGGVRWVYDQDTDVWMFTRSMDEFTDLV